MNKTDTIIQRELDTCTEQEIRITHIRKAMSALNENKKTFPH